jgi:molybdenum cofactor synthesis domain-containing protein
MSPTAAVLIIGNEILSGRTQDSNLHMIAKKLASTGIRLSEARVVADIEADIVTALNDLRACHMYVFTTGGIGPTHDDITADAIAKAFGVKLIEHPEARARLLAHYTEANLNEARLRMARTPEGAVLIDNYVSAAPGFRVENVYVLAGVPGIAEAMMDTIITTLKHGPAIYSIAVSGQVAESHLADDLRTIAALFPEIDIGSYPWFRLGKFGTVLVARGTDQKAVEKAAQAVTTLIEKHGVKPERE